VRVLVLDGSLKAGDPTEAVSAAVARLVEGRGGTVEVVRARDAVIAPCAGCFRCWYRTPGVCDIDDDARGIVRGMAQAHVLVFVSPVTFGGYSSPPKTVLDRSIGLVSPLFTTIGGETHHRRRYPRYPAVAAIGTQAAPDEPAGAVFSFLVGRNALNFHAPASGSEIVVWRSAGNPSPAEGRVDGAGAFTGIEDDALTRIDALLASLETAAGAATPDGSATDRSATDGSEPDDMSADRSSSGGGVPGALLDLVGPPAVGASPPAEAADGPANTAAPPRRALLLVGSPRPKRSTSAALGAYLAGRLEAAGVPAHLLNVLAVLEEPGGWRRLETAIGGADLLVLLTPLYVDSLPAPLTRVLELLAAKPLLPPGGGRVVGIVNSGFPEAVQCTAALAICRLFAEAVGRSWAGGLALGAGAAIDGRALEDTGKMGAKVRRSLELAAVALACGGSVPAEATERMGLPLFPAWQYRHRGDRAFRQLARQHGVEGELDRRPYDSQNVPAMGASGSAQRRKPKTT
jgi:multimeric flavodoxin WrbA